MIPLILPIAIGALTGAAFLKSGSNEPTPEVMAARKAVYEQALNTVKDPGKLQALAKSFREAGMIAEATMLEKRAALTSAPKELKKARREAYRKGMASTDPVKVRELAAAFEAAGATSSANSLNQYADGLEAAALDSPPIEAAPEADYSNGE